MTPELPPRGTKLHCAVKLNCIASSVPNVFWKQQFMEAWKEEEKKSRAMCSFCLNLEAICYSLKWFGVLKPAKEPHSDFI